MRLRNKVNFLILVTWALILSIMFMAAGLDGINVYEVLLCIVVFFVSILFWFLLDGLVLKRVGQLTQQVIVLSKEGGFKKNIELSGKDELSMMADEINTMLAMLRDAHAKEIEHNKQQLEETVNQDRVTTLPSRFFFNRFINEHVKNNLSTAMVGVFSVRNLRDITDALGFSEEEEALKQIAMRLKENFDESNLLARYSHDEFSFYLHDVDAKKTMRFSKGLLKTLRKPILLRDQDVYVKANVALTSLEGDTSDVALVQHQLTLALSQANTLGFDQVVVYEEAMASSEDQRRLTLGSDLHHAIDKKELFLVYQPKIALKDFCIEGVEVLLRWRHPTRGLISPTEFIPLAESLGLIAPISLWVIHEACRTCVAWKTSAGYPMSVAINISPLHFHQENFIDELMGVLAEHDVAPTQIELELTEGSIIGDVDFAVTRLKQLSSLGFRIAIDDFGTGYSSMRYLKDFPVHSMKIDKSFVDDVPGDKNNVAIIQAIIALAKSLGLRIVAEGAETKTQLDFLLNNDVDLVQGHVFSLSINEDGFKALLAHFQSKDIEKAYWQGVCEK